MLCPEYIFVVALYCQMGQLGELFAYLIPKVGSFWSITPPCFCQDFGIWYLPILWVPPFFDLNICLWLGRTHYFFGGVQELRTDFENFWYVITNAKWSSTLFKEFENTRALFAWKNPTTPLNSIPIQWPITNM